MKSLTPSPSTRVAEPANSLETISASIMGYNNSEGLAKNYRYLTWDDSPTEISLGSSRVFTREIIDASGIAHGEPVMRASSSVTVGASSREILERDPSSQFLSTDSPFIQSAHVELSNDLSLATLNISLLSQNRERKVRQHESFLTDPDQALAEFSGLKTYLATTFNQSFDEIQTHFEGNLKNIQRAQGQLSDLSARAVQRLEKSGDVISESELAALGVAVGDAHKYDQRNQRILGRVREKIAGCSYISTQERNTEASALIAAGLPTHDDFSRYISFRELKAQLQGLVAAVNPKCTPERIGSDDQRELITRFRVAEGSSLYFIGDDRMVLASKDVQVHISNLHNGRGGIEVLDSSTLNCDYRGSAPTYDAERMISEVLTRSGAEVFDFISLNDEARAVVIPAVDVEKRLEGNGSLFF